MNKFADDQGPSGDSATSSAVSAVEWMMKQGVKNLKTPSGKVRFFRKMIADMAKESPINLWGMIELRECVKGCPVILFPPDHPADITLATRVIPLAWWLPGQVEQGIFVNTGVYRNLLPVEETEKRLFLTKDESLIGVDLLRRLDEKNGFRLEEIKLRRADDAYLEEIFGLNALYFDWIVMSLTRAVKDAFFQAQRRLRAHENAYNVVTFTALFYKNMLKEE